MHNAAFRHLGLNCVYLAFDVLPHRLKDAVRGAQEMKFLGLNLTVPHKLLAFELVDILDTSAKDWGAVNTIRFEAKDKNGEWKPLIEFEDEIPEEIRSYGFNTDAEAITLALYEDFGLVPDGIKVLLLGAGGAGRVAALKLASCGIQKIYIVNRTQEKAISLAEEIKTRYPDVLVDLGYPEEKIDLVLNATSLGLKTSDPLPLDLTMFNLNYAALAYDMIYRPAETPFLQMAKKSGCKIANGLSMLLWQGVKALEIWINRPAPKEVMRDALIKNIYYGDH